MNDAKVRHDLVEKGFDQNPLDFLIAEGFEFMNELLIFITRSTNPSEKVNGLGEKAIDFEIDKIRETISKINTLDEETIKFCFDSSEVLKNFSSFERNIKESQKILMTEHRYDKPETRRSKFNDFINNFKK